MQHMTWKSHVKGTFWISDSPYLCFFFLPRTKVQFGPDRPRLGLLNCKWTRARIEINLAWIQPVEFKQFQRVLLCWCHDFELWRRKPGELKVWHTAEELLLKPKTALGFSSSVCIKTCQKNSLISENSGVNNKSAKMKLKLSYMGPPIDWEWSKTINNWKVTTICISSLVDCLDRFWLSILWDSMQNLPSRMGPTIFPVIIFGHHQIQILWREAQRVL